MSVCAPVSRHEDTPRARLASFDDCSLTNVLSARHDPDANSNVPLTMSSSLSRASFSDGDKLIDEFTSHPCFGDYSSENTCRSSEAPDMSDTNTCLQGETWLAPYHDYDLPLEISSSLYHQDELATTSQSLHPQTEHQFMAPRDRLLDAAIKMQAVVKLTRLQRVKKRARWLTKKLIVFILSHVGLTSLVGLYAVAGGFIFQRLERNVAFTGTEPPRAHDGASIRSNWTWLDRAVLETVRQQHVEELWNLTLSLNVLEPQLWKQKASGDLKLFERDIYLALLKSGSEMAVGTTTTPSIELHQSVVGTEWTYSSALLFAVTVITTIGYGDTVPRSWEAKLVCIVYAVFGIPLTLLCLANIGSLLASVYRFTWKHTTHLALVIVRAPERTKPLPATSKVRVPIWVSVVTMAVYILGGAAIFSEWENWTFLEGSYFCFITLSTIGFGDYVPGKGTETLDSNAKRVVCALYLLFGLALLSMIFQLIQDSVTIVVGRYASFLGLSEAQIERDIQEPSMPAPNRSEALAQVKDKDGTHGVEDNSQGHDDDLGHNGTLYSLPTKFGHVATSLHRVHSLPAHTTWKKPARQMARLHSVPEEKENSLCAAD